MAQEYLHSLLDRNTKAAESWHPMPTIEDMKNMKMNEGVTIIVTCADPRADPRVYLKLKPGEIPTIRNAGGRVTQEVFTSLELMSAVMDIGQLIIIHHTDCGGITVTNEQIRSTLAERAPEHADSVKDKDWHSYRDIGMDQSIRDDVTVMKKWKFMAKGTVVSGYVFDIKTGLLREVVAAETLG